MELVKGKIYHVRGIGLLFTRKMIYIGELSNGIHRFIHQDPETKGVSEVIGKIGMHDGSNVLISKDYEKSHVITETTPEVEKEIEMLKTANMWIEPGTVLIVKI